MADRDLDDALHSLAGDMQRTGRIAPAADIRRRGDRRRRMHNVAAAAAGVVAIGAVAVGIALAQPDQHNGLPANLPSTLPPPSAAVTTPPSVTPTTAASRPPSTPPTSRTTPTSKAPAANNNPILAGKRQVAMVRVQSFESGVTLTDDGKLSEADDDSGSQLFVLVPLDDGRYLIRTAERRENNEAACWQVKHNGTAPLSVIGAACDTSDTAQQFEVTPRGSAYAISNRSAFLQYSSRNGLIVEELGDAPLETTFRLVDNGSAPN